jgi:hypothetical protein
MKSGWASIALLLAAGAALGPAACGSHETPAPATLPRAALLDPETCSQCHAAHYTDWGQSMHAYASKDPVFLAMNARGQRETNGALGTFCVQCHAPMAVRDGMTKDGLNLSSLPDVYQQGVTCFFCHSIESVGTSHDASLDNSAVNLASDLVMRGEYPNSESTSSVAAGSSLPLVSNSAHASTYSPLHDRHLLGSSSLCGACHDVVTPAGGAIERTFYEWSHSAFGTTSGSTCAADGCHMTAIPESIPIASGQGFTAPNRTVHEHDFPAVDVALDPTFTRASVERGVVQQKLDAETLQGAVCVTAAGGIRVVLDDVAVGHQWPSGASQDRRAWVEVKAFQNGNPTPIYQSGVVPDGGTPTTVQNDPDLWLLRDCMFGPDGGQVDMFWQAASTEGNELPALNSFSGTNFGTYTHRVQLFPRSGNPLPMKPDDVQVRVWIQPVGLDVLSELVDSGDLDASVIAKMPTFQVSLTGPTSTAPLEWTAATGTLGFQNDPYDNTPSTCVASSSAFNVSATLATNHTKCAP